MATVVFAYNHSRDPMNPVDLSIKIAAALAIPVIPNADISPTQIIVAGAGITEAGRTTMQGVIDTYVLDPVGAGGPAAVLAQRAAAALAANSAFLALASPSPAQVLAQVQTLTKENNALIRLTLSLFDTTTGT